MNVEWESEPGFEDDSQEWGWGLGGPGPALKGIFPVPSFRSLASCFIQFIIIICLLFLVSGAFGNLTKVMDFQKNTLYSHSNGCFQHSQQATPNVRDAGQGVFA